MNSARTLYSILNIIIFLLLISIGLGIFFYAMMLFGVEQNLIDIDKELLDFRTEGLINIYTILKLGIYAIFIAAIWKLRKATKLLIKKDFYNDELITALLTSGKFMVISCVLLWCIDWISNIFFKFKSTIHVDEKTLVYLFIISMGLFLMLISIVLKDAQTLKEENDLTV